MTFTKRSKMNKEQSGPVFGCERENYCSGDESIRLLSIN